MVASFMSRHLEAKMHPWSYVVNVSTDDFHTPTRIQYPYLRIRPELSMQTAFSF